MKTIRHTVKSDSGAPTEEAYKELRSAYRYFNAELFDDALPECLITLQRKDRRSLGYFSPDRFEKISGEVTDEIAMNPMHFASIGQVEVLQTLVHEMCHLWQKHFGVRSRAGYHNKEWGAKMKAVGLQPSSTGRPGGKETGQRMSDYVIKGGAFERVTAALLEGGFQVSWHDALRWSEPSANGEGETGEGDEPIKDRSNRVKYSCAECGLNAWGKLGLPLMCGRCKVDLQMV